MENQPRTKIVRTRWFLLIVVPLIIISVFDWSPQAKLVDWVISLFGG